MHRILALVTLLVVGGLILASPRPAFAGPCWYCQCVTNCSCFSGGTGSSCTASSSGCTVSGNCQFTSTPGGALVRPGTNDRVRRGDATGESALLRAVAASEATAWTSVAPGRFVERTCAGAIIRTRTTHTAGALLRGHSSVLSV